MRTMKELINLIDTFFTLINGVKIESEESQIVVMCVCSIQANLGYEVTMRGESDVKKELISYINYFNK